MESIEHAIIRKQSARIGELETANIELSLRLEQAVATAKALEKEVNKDGDITEK
ncbi:MAG: hypothetical protein ABS939_02470 [Psychrobacillus sp.]